MGRMQTARLVRMAEHIALNVGADTAPERAAERLADHLQRFWTRAMIGQLADYARGADAGLSPVVRAALEHLHKA